MYLINSTHLFLQVLYQCPLPLAPLYTGPHLAPSVSCLNLNQILHGEALLSLWNFLSLMTSNATQCTAREWKPAMLVFTVNKWRTENAWCAKTRQEEDAQSTRSKRTVLKVAQPTGYIETWVKERKPSALLPQQKQGPFLWFQGGEGSRQKNWALGEVFEEGHNM